MIFFNPAAGSKNQVMIFKTRITYKVIGENKNSSFVDGKTARLEEIRK
jgi:hypothetical protein